MHSPASLPTPHQHARSPLQRAAIIALVLALFALVGTLFGNQEAPGDVPAAVAEETVTDSVTPPTPDPEVEPQAEDKSKKEPIDAATPPADAGAEPATEAAEAEVAASVAEEAPPTEATRELSIRDSFKNLWYSTGIYAFLDGQREHWTLGSGRLLMILVGLGLLYLGIVKKFEPLLLVPIGIGAILANIPLAGITDDGGVLYYVYNLGIATGVFPLLIFMGVGAMTDFGPLLANPKTGLLGAAAQFGIFSTFFGALLLTQAFPGINFSLEDAAAIAIIGGADGPTSIFLATNLSPRLLGSIAVAAYSYMALVPIIQPPIMKLLTNEAERKIGMSQLRYVSKREKILFPIIVLLLCVALLPSAAPLIGFLMFGNLMRECGVVDRLKDTAENALINIVTIFLGLGVGGILNAGGFLNLETLGILILGLAAFVLGTAAGVIMAKLMNCFLSQKLNPLIGAAGVSAVPMAARVVNKVGMHANPSNFLLMHAMGPNVAGVIGSAVAAGVLLSVFS